MTSHQQAFWRKSFDLLQPRKKSTKTALRWWQNSTFRIYGITATPDEYRSRLRHLLRTDHPQTQAVLQPHACCSHGRIPNKKHGFMFAHLVCQYCFVSPRTTWRTDGSEGRYLVRSCSFRLYACAAVGQVLLLKHSALICMTCDRNTNFSRLFRNFACF